jgi:hypothetical protein
MSGKSKWDYLKAIYFRYRKASKPLRSRILDEFCQVCRYNRKYAIRLLNGPAPQKTNTPIFTGRRPTYGIKVIGALTAIWQAAGYPCSARLKALLPLWLPWASKRLTLSAQAQKQLLTVSPATIDRRLRPKKHQLKNRLYGRTKPGTLLKHHIPIKTDSWNVHTPGFTETDLVSHSGNSASGEFIHSLNVTDIHSTWVESRAVMGKSQIGVLEAMKDIQQALPFKLWASIPITAQSLSTTTSRPSVINTKSNLPEGVLTKRTITPISNRKTGPMCAKSSAMNATTPNRPLRP